VEHRREALANDLDRARFFLIDRLGNSSAVDLGGKNAGA